MTSSIFNSIGLGNMDPAIPFLVLLVLFIILLIVVIIQGAGFRKLKKTYNAFMDGGNGQSMENEILALFEDIRFLKKAEKKDSRDIAAIRDNLVFAYQKIGLVKYDAFREMGGKLSFCIALLNDQNDGFIINSVHGSDGSYTYAKEIISAHSGVALGEEEQEALNKALGFVGASSVAVSAFDEPEEEEEEKSLPPVKVSRVQKQKDFDDADEEEYTLPAKRLLRKNEEAPQRPTSRARVLRHRTSEGIETEKSQSPGVRNTESLPDTSAITRKLSEISKKEMLRDLIMDDDGEPETETYEDEEPFDMASFGFEEVK